MGSKSCYINYIGNNTDAYAQAVNNCETASCPAHLASCQNSLALLSEEEINEGIPPEVTAELVEEGQVKDDKIKKYYEKQMQFIKDVEEDKQIVKESEEKYLQDERQAEINELSSPRGTSLESNRESITSSIDPKTQKRDSLLGKISFGANFVLFVAKIVASVLSGSLSVIASAVDSAVDLTSGLVIWLSNRAIRHRNPYKYPRGRTRLEPLAAIIVSVIMGVASMQVILQSIQEMIQKVPKPEVGAPTIAVMGATVVVKLILYIICCIFKGPSANVLAQDHRNDTISNSVAIVCAYVGANYWGYIDPIGAILVSISICISWYITGCAHAAVITGLTASPEYTNRILAICVDHHPAIKHIENVKAYHLGTNLLVEVDVVMDEHMTLKAIHDISEPLQRKIEHLPYVERAFLHVDYEYEHRPEAEHKVV